MNIAKTVKTLSIVAVTSLGLYAGASQADYEGYRGNPYMPPPPVRLEGSLLQQINQLDARLDSQLQRILDGMESGGLNMREAIWLLRENQAINALERQYLRDGRLGPYELADLDRRLDQASSHIYAEKHDDDRAGYHGHGEGGRR
ncbi:MAG TPA: hypothetical protein PLL19_11130 [Thiobacillaceae bacterium]|nr:hypothetical protein [Thiobacillaceae bacterium]HNA82501.1 hypothetical protein [Thiobacillaceae bacterium]HNF89876.1 hypothetical protein [Thiobacillaceae bacterium]HNH90395.1 hypothetical protein [Thiobacillaceae bacterium]HNI08914.1 hypothetical protein [Thiobacillaceae bacterium]